MDVVIELQLCNQHSPDVFREVRQAVTWEASGSVVDSMTRQVSGFCYMSRPEVTRIENGALIGLGHESNVESVWTN